MDGLPIEKIQGGEAGGGGVDGGALNEMTTVYMNMCVDVDRQ